MVGCRANGVILALALAACGSQPSAGNAGQGGTESANSATFTARARQVVAQWQVSPAARAWRTGLVLLGPGELTSIPRNAGFANQPQKDAFGSGRFRLVGVLPQQALHGRVRWADGSTQAVPLLGAQAAFRQLAANQACAVPPCGQLTITSAWPATITVDTSKGPAVILAWRFTMAELGWPVTEAAASTRPGPPSSSALGPAVAIMARHAPRWRCCVPPGSRSRPLGSRVVLDVASGQPLVLGGPMRE